MGINATLIGQMGTFLVFILFTMKFVWPHITKAMADRQQRIADGLAAAEKGVRDLDEAKVKAADINKQAREEASEIVGQANKRGINIVEEAKTQAQAERDRILVSAQAEIEQERNRLREALRGEVSAIAVAGAGRILEREIDAKAHAEMLDKLAAQL